MNNRLLIILRYALISLVILAVSGLVIYKMVDNTILHADNWNERALKELSKTEVIHPRRGNILAADGRTLATNLCYYTLRIDFTSEQFRYKNLIDSMPALLDSLAANFRQRDREGWKQYLERGLTMRSRYIAKLDSLSNKNLTPEQLKTLTEQAKKLRRTLNSWPLMRKVEYSSVEQIKTFPFFNIDNSAKTGLIVEAVTVRTKPYGDLARQSIGIVYEDPKRKNESHGFSGLEGALDSLLYGIPGKSKKVPLTRHITNWTDTAAIPGFDVLTTIDIDIQDIVESELMRMLDTCDADWGSAVLMEVSTGNIKAISNLRKKGNHYEEGINYAVRCYEPGSVVKPLSMLIALEDGLVRNLDEHIPTGGSWAYTGRYPIRDSHAHSSVAVRDVICYSSNIATAKIILRGFESNPAGFTERLRSIGFMDPLGVGICGELGPDIKEDPTRLDLSRMAYGYTTGIPPMHTLSIYNAIANDGKYVRPRLYTRLMRPDTIIDIPVSYIRDSICSRRNAAILREMIHDVVWKDGGTGRLVRSKVVDIAGKTGTCYMIPQGAKNYDTSMKRLAFCGFFPYDKPKYSCIVLTANPRRYFRGAASTSGQVMKGIALKLHARGMLDNSGDISADTHPGTCPTLYATTAPNPYTGLADDLRLSSPRRGRTPAATPSGTAPSVTGLSLREAVNSLEDAGYNVVVRGNGYVSSQSPAPGDTIQAGTTFTLTLTQDT